MWHLVHEYTHEPSASSYGLEAAQKLGLDPLQVFKTLIAVVDGKHCVAVVPVSSQVSLKALAKALGGKHAAMADPNDAMRITGYVVGGISPLGQKKLLPTAIDEMAMEWETIFVSAGKRGFDVEVKPSDLMQLTQAVLADIAV
ncbi:unannotated protein [freshwater metagenome]|uniref:Unannotated protein n=1 Tax=freshwater metagenome TaxID=449393 RepID=A0A6J5YR19_9ZZZZ